MGLVSYLTLSKLQFFTSSRKRMHFSDAVFSGTYLFLLLKLLTFVLNKMDADKMVSHAIL